MGMFDRIELIEPLPCYSCFSTAEDDIGTNKQLSEIELGENKLQLLRIHDGKGGIKVFQTKDLDCLLNNYWFPGSVPSRGKSFYNGMWEIDHDNPTPLSLIEICNSCNSVWRGDLYLKYEKENDIFLTDFIEMWTEEGNLLMQQEQENKIYHISLINDKIRITPKIPNAIKEYRRRAEESQRKAENYQTFLDSINIEHKEIIKNSELHGFRDRFKSKFAVFLASNILYL